MGRAFDVTTSTLASVVRLGAGWKTAHVGKQPAKLLELYEFEACPFCRKAREALSQLDLDAKIFPCPRNGSRYRDVVKAKGGQEQFPYLVDPNTDRAMYESDAIIRYLADTYGDGVVPLGLRLGPLTTLGSGLASLMRPTKGRTATPSRVPDAPLELWSFEASPYCRLVREALCSLELPYILHNVSPGSQKRESFIARSGKMMVPYLFDPNTDKEMFESADILRYLETTYGAPAI